MSFPNIEQLGITRLKQIARVLRVPGYTTYDDPDELRIFLISKFVTKAGDVRVPHLRKLGKTKDEILAEVGDLISAKKSPAKVNRVRDAASVFRDLKELHRRSDEPLDIEERKLILEYQGMDNDLSLKELIKLIIEEDKRKKTIIDQYHADLAREKSEAVQKLHETEKIIATLVEANSKIGKDFSELKREARSNVRVAVEKIIAEKEKELADVKHELHAAEKKAMIEGNKDDPNYEIVVALRESVAQANRRIEGLEGKIEDYILKLKHMKKVEEDSHRIRIRFDDTEKELVKRIEESARLQGIIDRNNIEIAEMRRQAADDKQSLRKLNDMETATNKATNNLIELQSAIHRKEDEIARLGNDLKNSHEATTVALNGLTQAIAINDKIKLHVKGMENEDTAKNHRIAELEKKITEDANLIFANRTELKIAIDDLKISQEVIKEIEKRVGQAEATVERKFDARIRDMENKLQEVDTTNRGLQQKILELVAEGIMQSDAAAARLTACDNSRDVLQVTVNEVKAHSNELTKQLESARKMIIELESKENKSKEDQKTIDELRNVINENKTAKNWCDTRVIALQADWNKCKLALSDEENKTAAVVKSTAHSTIEISLLQGRLKDREKRLNTCTANNEILRQKAKAVREGLPGGEESIRLMDARLDKCNQELITCNHNLINAEKAEGRIIGQCSQRMKETSIERDALIKMVKHIVANYYEEDISTVQLAHANGKVNIVLITKSKKAFILNEDGDLERTEPENVPVQPGRIHQLGQGVAHIGKGVYNAGAGVLGRLWRKRPENDESKSDSDNEEIAPEPENRDVLNGDYPDSEENDDEENDEIGDEEIGDEEIGDEENDDEEIGDEEIGDEENGDEEIGDEEIGDEEIGDEEIGDEEIGDEEIGDEENEN